MKRFGITKVLLILVVMLSLLVACEMEQTTDQKVQKVAKQQEQIAKEQVAQLGMPAIINNTEKAMLKMILEKRDDPKLINYLYTFSDYQARWVYIGKCIGYPMPYATQYTNPMRALKNSETEMAGNVTLPQADPNGLYSPTSAEASWVMMINPNNNKPEIQYFEQRVSAFSYKL